MVPNFKHHTDVTKKISSQYHYLFSCVPSRLCSSIVILKYTFQCVVAEYAHSAYSLSTFVCFICKRGSQGSFLKSTTVAQLAHGVQSHANIIFGLFSLRS